MPARFFGLVQIMKPYVCKFKIGDKVKPLVSICGWELSDILVVTEIIWADDFRKYLLCDSNSNKDFGLFDNEVRPLTKLEKVLL